MSKLIPGMKVIFIGDDNQVERGTLKSVYDLYNTGIVTLEDGITVRKVELDKLGIVPEKKTETPEVQEGAKIITSDQFREALNSVTSPEGMLGEKVYESDPVSVALKGLTVKIIAVKMAKELFKDSEEIEISKKQLEAIIKTYTDPVEISKSVNGSMSVTEVFPISLLSTIILSRLVYKLFDGPENE